MAVKTIKKVVTKPAVTTPTVSTDPNVLYQQLAQMPQGGATPFDQTYNDAANKYRAASNATYVLPDVLKSYLGQVSPQYTQDKSAVLAQFADKNSPLYISNPFARLQAAQAAQTGQQQTYSQVLDRVNRLVGMGVAQQQQNVSDLGAQVTSAQQAQKDQRAALQQQFSNALSIASNNRANASANTANDPFMTSNQKVWDSLGQLGFSRESDNSGGYSFFQNVNGVKTPVPFQTIQKQVPYVSPYDLLYGSTNKGDVTNASINPLS